MDDFGDVFSFGEEAEQISAYKLIEKEMFKEKWILTIGPVLNPLT